MLQVSQFADFVIVINFEIGKFVVGEPDDEFIKELHARRMRQYPSYFSHFWHYFYSVVKIQTQVYLNKSETIMKAMRLRMMHNKTLLQTDGVMRKWMSKEKRLLLEQESETKEMTMTNFRGSGIIENKLVL